MRRCSHLNDCERNGLEGDGEREAVSLPPGGGGPRSPVQEASVRHGAGFPRAQWPSAQTRLARPPALPLHPAQKTRAGQWPRAERGPLHPQPLAGWPTPRGIFRDEERRAQSPLERGEEGQHGPERARSRPVERGSRGGSEEPYKRQRRRYTLARSSSSQVPEPNGVGDKILPLS